MIRVALLVVSLLTALKTISQDKNLPPTYIKTVSAKDIKAIIDTTSVPTIINFWASWCGPCIREIPWFDSIIAKKDLRVRLLLVSLDFPKEYPWKLTAFVKKEGYKGEVVFMNETNSQRYISEIDRKWTGEIPASIFINHAKKYYQLFNHQLPPKRLELELDKLVK